MPNRKSKDVLDDEWSDFDDEEMLDGENGDASTDADEVGDLDDSDDAENMDEDDDDDDDNDEDGLSNQDEEADNDMEGAEGVPLLNGRQVSPSSIPFSTTASTSAVETPGILHPQKQTPYVLDAGHLLISDPNPLHLVSMANAAALEEQLTSTARDAAQSLLNHLLTTCPIHRAPISSTSSSGVTMSLPPANFQLPREKRIPTPKPPTKWEQFAARKGITKDKRKSGTGTGELASTEGKMVYDEASGEWVPKWGYKGRNKKGEGDWLVEVDEKKEKRELDAADPRGASRLQRKDRMRRNERAQRANERKARKKAGD